MSLDIVTFKSAPIEIIDGDRGKNYPKQDEFTDEGYCLFLNAKNITENGFNFDTKMFISEEKDNLLRKGKLQKGDVILTTRGTVGNVAFYSEHIPYNNIRINSGMLILRSKQELDNEFLYWTLKSNYFKKQIYTFQSGTAQLQLPISSLKHIEFYLPPINIQKKIVKILSQIDNKIRILKYINKNLEELAKAIYRHHFIDFKPYALGGLMKHSSQGMIPKDWSVQSIEEFVDDMKNGGTPKRGESDYWDNGTVPWLKTGEINNNIIIKSEEHITELGLKNSSAKLLPINSIIMALYGKGTAARIGLLKFEATTNQACCAMICNDFNKTLFLYLFLLFNQKEIENLASGSVQQNLSKDLIANLELVVPPIEIIDNLPFKEIFDTIANNYFEIEYLINLRDTLLPKLMSGEIDVSKINCDLKIIIRKIYIKSSKLFLWRYLSENKNYIKNTKSNETLLKSRTIYKINKFLAKFNARYRYYRQ